MRRRRSAVVLPVVIGGLLVAGAVPASAVSGMARYTGQKLAWHLCTDDELPAPRPPGSDELECATFRTPRDWDRLTERRDLTIAVSRLKSTSDTTSSVLTNPGGPGGEGRSLPVLFRGQSGLREHQEIIGMDPRGTGKSTNITCGGAVFSSLDPRDRDPRNMNDIVDELRNFAKDCERSSGDLVRLIDTYQTIRDMDLLRVLLGRHKVNYVGYSGGSWLGAHYAQQFPERTGRFVLDSNVEFTAAWEKFRDEQPFGFERRWRQDFLPWIARYDAKYHFGATAEEARQNYESIRASLSRRPIDLDGVRIGPAELDSFILSMLYGKANFPPMADLFVNIKRVTDADTPEQAKVDVRAVVKAVKSVEAPDASIATLTAVLCNDGPWSGDRRSLIRKSQEFLDRGATLDSYWINRQACVFWKNERFRPLPTMDGRGVPPVLMVQSERDPGTPIEGARRAHAAFQNSRMLTVTDEGDHGIYSLGNKAVDKIVNAYLVDGVVPQDQNVPGMPLPVPTQ
jgi:pimeloyl-ACP methyl ester carboxylesterase